VYFTLKKQSNVHGSPQCLFAEDLPTASSINCYTNRVTLSAQQTYLVKNFADV